MTTDTKAVARWEFVGACVRSASARKDGDYVLFTDHEQVVGKLGKDRNEWKQLADSHVEVIREIRTTLAASRAEVEGLKEMIRTMQNNPEFDFGAAMEKGNV